MGPAGGRGVGGEDGCCEQRQLEPGPQGKPLPSPGILVGGRFPGSCLVRALHACTS